MSRHDEMVAVQHMLDYAEKALLIAQNKKRNDLDADLTLNLALTRLVEVIGEAANRVPKEFQDSHSEIAWPQIIGMRNRLIHGYDDVDLDFLWSVVKKRFANADHSTKSFVMKLNGDSDPVATLLCLWRLS